MKDILKKIILLIIAVVVIYSVAFQERRVYPVDECYRVIWGDLNRMRELGLEDLSAMDVYEYCREVIINADPMVHSQGDANTPRRFIMGEPEIEVMGGEESYNLDLNQDSEQELLDTPPILESP